MLHRPRRLRKLGGLRALVQEHVLRPQDLIAPLFLQPGKTRKETPIASLSGQSRLTLDLVFKEVETLLKLSVPAICLFPVVPEELKDPKASYALREDNFYLKAISALVQKFPELVIMTDIALDPYSSDGHDGLVDPKTGEIKNDETLEVLTQMGLLQAQAGAHILGPSDMMDGRVKHLRLALEKKGHKDTAIMSYTAKYASSFYGPFRDALGSAPKKGDKKTYQMDYANTREAVRELYLDLSEGADICMVKPGLPYLDILCEMRRRTPAPLAVYQVSGEYAMLMGAIEKGWMNEGVILETLMAFKRAGADMILTYFAKRAAQLLGSS